MLSSICFSSILYISDLIYLFIKTGNSENCFWYVCWFCIHKDCLLVCVIEWIQNNFFLIKRKENKFFYFSFFFIKINSFLDHKLLLCWLTNSRIIIYIYYLIFPFQFSLLRLCFSIPLFTVFKPSFPHKCSSSPVFYSLEKLINISYSVKGNCVF